MPRSVIPASAATSRSVMPGVLARQMNTRVWLVRKVQPGTDRRCPGAGPRSRGWAEPHPARARWQPTAGRPPHGHQLVQRPRGRPPSPTSPCARAKSYSPCARAELPLRPTRIQSLARGDAHARSASEASSDESLTVPRRSSANGEPRAESPGLEVVGYPPLVEMDDQQRRQLHEALLEADALEDLPQKWQAT